MPFTSSAAGAAAGWGTAPLLADVAYTDRECLLTLETQKLGRIKAVIDMSAVSGSVRLCTVIASNAGAYIRDLFQSNAMTHGALSN